jgi:predicted nucleic acid-binding protein
MSIRTTVTLDDDVVARVKRESRSRGASFRDTLNDLLRAALVGIDNQPRRHALGIKATPMGHKPGLNYDSIESLIEYGEGERHREILEKLVSDHGAIGPLVTDAVLAALAIEYGASLASTDHNFRRFRDLRWLNPLSA